MSILEGLQDSVKAALKSGDKERVTVLRMIVNELQKEAKQTRQDLDESAELAVLRRELKRREESVEAFKAGGRDDLVAHEELAAGIIEELLPKQMDEAELSTLIDRVVAESGSTSVREMGKVMAAVMAEGGVRVDGKLASRLVKERLSLSKAATKQIDLDNQTAALLVGENDAHLRTLEGLLGCDIGLRGNQLTLDGSSAEVERGEALVSELLALLKSGQGLDSSTLKLAASLSADAGNGHSLGDIVGDVILEHRGRRIRPKTVNQKAYVDAIRQNTITFGIGPAGTGKTYLAMAMATAALLSGEVARVILTRPAVEAGEKLGFLPGGLMEKVDPYLRPLFDALYDMMDTERLTDHLARGTIEVAPLAYMRGRTLNDSLIILDEAQNTSPEQMKMFLTRLGFGAKMIVTGDITQIDLPRGERSGLVNVREVLASIPDIAFVYFDSQDVVRHKLVQDIVSAYKKHADQSQAAAHKGPSHATGEARRHARAGDAMTEHR